jgi:hypothetical protein
MLLDPLRGPPQRGDERLHLGRILVDRRLLGEMGGNRNFSTDVLVPDGFVGSVE